MQKQDQENKRTDTDRISRKKTSVAKFLTYKVLVIVELLVAFVTLLFVVLSLGKHL